MRTRTAVGVALGFGLAVAGFSSGCGLIAGVRDAVPYPTDGGGGRGGSGGGGGGGGAAATSSTGGAPACMPGTAVACYSGKDGEQGTGQCKAGTKTCNADGTGYDACMGEVLPGTESCKTPGDEDCDGSACSDCVWSFLAGDAEDQFPTDIAIDSSGNIVVVGYYSGTLKLQNKVSATSTTLNATGMLNSFLAKFDAHGDVLWAKGFGVAAGGGFSPISVAIHSNGDIGIAGGLSKPTSFGGKILPVVGLEDIFVAKLDSGGNHIWSQSFGSQQFSFAEATAIAFDTTGNLVVAAKANNNITLGTTSFTVASFYDAFIMTMTGSTGDIAWAKQYKEKAGQANGNQSITHLTTDASSNIYVGGTFSGAICLVAGTSSCVNATGGGSDTDIFVAKLDKSGTVSR